MPNWLLITLGIAVALGIIIAVFRLAFGIEGRTKRQKWGGRPSWREDRGPSVGTSNDPISGD